ncbi:GntR family transcriptional regulator [Streptomyces sp. NBC_00249]|uniref:GntR family transcriptional regulator n=1 Tax=Streptomyces sp. NBC_00249 TaxID=2975690 RepID=UPI00224F54F8|nr:GntR family transcriptional regulator [Streptomyces sp. NBC_00249]MCX5195192.1 GntR family transcriptional regulator [Streptomyces sp. NBC_00249]
MNQAPQAPQSEKPETPDTPGRRASGRTPLYLTLAADLRGAITAGEYGSGARLPAEDELARRYGVSRGTVRQALAALRTDGLITSRRGTRRVVLAGPGEGGAVTELRSFTRWARSLGQRPGGRTVSVEEGAADAEEAEQLRLESGAAVHRVLRLRTLAGEPVMVERTTYPREVGALVAAMPPDTLSYSEQLARHGVLFTDAHHTIDIAFADAEDAALLGCRAGEALLRERRRSTDPAGTPVEWSQDRYLPGTVAFTAHSTGAFALGRRLGP